MEEKQLREELSKLEDLLTRINLNEPDWFQKWKKLSERIDEIYELLATDQKEETQHR